MRTPADYHIQSLTIMRILIADNLSSIAMNGFQTLGFTCDLMPDITPDELPAHIAGYEVLIVRSTKVTSETLEAGVCGNDASKANVVNDGSADCSGAGGASERGANGESEVASNSKLKLVVRAGSGTNTIDCERATELGVHVCNVPGRNAIAVAELALGLMIAVDRHIVASTTDTRAGVWNKKAYSKSKGLHGSTLGVIGMGAVGYELSKRARAFEMNVIATDTPENSMKAIALLDAIDGEYTPYTTELLSASDFVSLHVPALPSTTGMVDSSFLAAMKPSSVLINTSRGEIVNEKALLAALNNTDLRAGLDVVLNEPKRGIDSFYSELASHPKVVNAHHIGASTQQAQRSVAEGTVDVVRAYSEGSLLHCVNSQ